MTWNRYKTMILATAFGCGLLMLPRWADGQEGTFDDLIETIVVEIPVQVVDDGRPVRGLSAENFEIYDGRKKQPITDFEVVDLTAAEKRGGAIAPVPVAARRHFLFAFDLSLSDPTAVARAREAAQAMVDRLRPTDLVAVATYSQSKGSRLVLGFTPDRQQVRIALQTLGLLAAEQRIADPLGMVLAPPGLVSSPDGSSPSASEPGEGGGPSRIERIDTDQVFADQLRDLTIATSRNTRSQARDYATAFARGIQDMARLMESVEGRKHVVLLSEGIEDTALFGTATARRQMELAEASSRGESWRIDSDERFGSSSAMSLMNEVVETFRRADATIQAVDISWLRPDATAAGSRQNALFMLADATGGELYRNFAEVESAMDQLLDRTSVVYLLAFQPEDLELDGTFHKVRVELKGVPRGTRVVHRPGYFAPKPFQERSGLERRMQAADLVLGGEEHAEIGVSVLAAPLEAEGDLAYVPVLVEIDGPSLLAASDGSVASLELYGYAIRQDGSVADFFTQSLGLELARVRPVLEQAGVKYLGLFDLPPGRYALRLLLRDGRTGRTSLQATSIEVPDGREPSLVAPLVPEPPGKWLMVVDPEAKEREYPFMLTEGPYVPAARPELVSGRAVTLALQGHNLGQPVAAEVRILGSGAEPVSSPALTLDGTLADGSLLASFTPSGVPPGSYRLVVTVEGSAGKASSSVEVVVR